MKRKTLYNFNSVQLTFSQCVLNRIQYRTEHNLYSTRLDKVDRLKSSTRSVQFNTAWRMEKVVLSTFHFPGNEKGRNDPSIRVYLPYVKEIHFLYRSGYWSMANACVDAKGKNFERMLWRVASQVSTICS